MPISRQKKQEILTELAADMHNAKSVFFAQNLGLSVKEIQKMRNDLRNKGGKYQIAKKTLIRKAISENLNIEVNDEQLVGPVGTVFAMEDALEIVKLLVKIEKETQKITVTGGIFEGKLLTQQQAIALSKLPSREELLAKLLGTMQAPLSNFVSLNSQLIAGFVRVIDGYREQKEGQAA